MNDIIAILEFIQSLPTGVISAILEVICWIDNLLGSPLGLSFCD